MTADDVASATPIRLDIAAGDTFVVMVEKVLSVTQRTVLEDYATSRLPEGTRVLILDGAASAHVASKRAAAGQGHRDKPAKAGDFLGPGNCPQAFLDWLGIPRDTKRFVLTMDAHSFAQIELTRLVRVDLEAAEQLEAATGRRYELREIPTTKEPQA